VWYRARFLRPRKHKFRALKYRHPQSIPTSRTGFILLVCACLGTNVEFSVCRRKRAELEILKRDDAYVSSTLVPHDTTGVFPRKGGKHLPHSEDKHNSADKVGICEAENQDQSRLTPEQMVHRLVSSRSLMWR
jgi:hypothetical protein